MNTSLPLVTIDGLAQVIEGKAIELIDGLTLEVEIQFDDAALKSLNRDGFTFVNHQLISTVWKLNVTCRTSSARRPSPLGVATPGETTPTDTINRADGVCVANARFIRPFDLGEHTFMEKRSVVNRLAGYSGALTCDQTDKPSQRQRCCSSKYPIRFNQQPFTQMIVGAKANEPPSTLTVTHSRGT
jgi:hypothetical protein